MTKKLVIAPHADDEVLGCGGILDKESHVFYCGVELNHVIPRDDRLDEIRRVAAFFGFTYEATNFTNCNSYAISQFIDIFQKVINEYQPDEVYIPYPSYNQDHRIINLAALVALRPHDKNFFVRRVMVYEEMDCIWGCEPPKVNMFVPIDLGRKLQGYSFHKSQVREHRSYAHIAALAKLRGAAIGVEHAEAFIIERWVP